MAFGDRQHRILRFWRDLEVFTPQGLACLNDGQRLASPTYVTHEGQRWPVGVRQTTVTLSGPRAGVLPWTAAAREAEQRNQPDLVSRPWRGHRVYLGIVEASAVSDALLKLAPMQGVGGPSADIAQVNFEEKWRPSGRHALLALSADEDGFLDPASICVSSLILGLEALSAGRLRAGGLRLNDRLIAERQALCERIQDREDVPMRLLDREFLVDELDRLRKRLPQLESDAWHPHVLIESFPRSLDASDLPRVTGDVALADPLNSLHFEPLHALVQELDPDRRAPGHALQRPSAALSAFLADPVLDEDKVDWLAQPGAFTQAIAPARLPVGSWPSAHPLAAGPLGVASEILHQVHAGGLTAVHAPPGTGPASLVKELVADLVVTRADQLASKDDALDWLVPVPVDGQAPWVLPDPTLLRHGLIVLTGPQAAQMAADLPKARRVTDPQWRYLAPLADAWAQAEALEGPPGPLWGPIALILDETSEAPAGRDRLLGLSSGRMGSASRVGLAHLMRGSVPWRAPEWTSARARYLAAKERVEQALAEVVRALDQGQALHLAWRARPQIESHYAQAAESLAVWGTLADQRQSPVARALDEADNRVKAVCEDQERAADRLRHLARERDELDRRHPVSAWSARKAALGWVDQGMRQRRAAFHVADRQVEGAQAVLRVVNMELDAARAAAAAAAQEWNEFIAQWHVTHRRRQNDMFALQERLTNLQLEIEALEGVVVPAVRAELARWRQPLNTHRAHHAMAPWSSTDWPEAQVWLAARQELFFCAMELHEAALFAWRTALDPAFLHHLPHLMTDPSSVPSALREPLWNLLGFVCPVVATPLAGLARHFAGLPAGSLGTLVVTEAAQATPGAIAWGLQRSHRAVVMGDPRQIEPEVALAPSLIDRLVEAHQAEPRHRPDRTSAQTLADSKVRVGTWIESFTAGEDARVWTGLPLRAHRRCQSPMFDIANQIAYDEQLTQATPEAHLCREGRLMSSFWWDVENHGDAGASRHVVEDELRALNALLRAWKAAPPTAGPTGTERPATLLVLSPFRSVVEAARGQIAAVGLSQTVRAGTVHACQGQEADSVVLILGTAGGAAGAGARQWASQSPQLLNVAVTRAREQLVVIGSRLDWQSRPFFDTLARHLPPRLDKNTLKA